MTDEFERLNEIGADLTQLLIVGPSLPVTAGC